jgi:hypothetical protein
VTCEWIQLPGGGSAVVCSSSRAVRCSVCGTLSKAIKLCDGPPPPGVKRKTCDAKVCPKCALHVEGQDIDYCPPCAAARAAKEEPMRGGAPPEVVAGVLAQACKNAGAPFAEPRPEEEREEERRASKADAAAARARLEELARAFKLDTTFDAPGFHAPGADSLSDQVRAQMWAEWLRERRLAEKAAAPPPPPAGQAELPIPDPRPNSPEDLGARPPPRAEPPPPPPAAGSADRPSAGRAGGHEAKLCSSCSAPILWCQVLELDEHGAWARAKKDDGRMKAIPVDYQPDPGGNIVLQHWREAGQVKGIVARVFKDPTKAREAFPEAPLRKSHFATCPDSKKHRRNR